MRIIKILGTAGRVYRKKDIYRAIAGLIPFTLVTQFEINGISYEVITRDDEGSYIEESLQAWNEEFSDFDLEEK